LHKTNWLSPTKELWRAKAPPRVKFFFWLPGDEARQVVGDGFLRCREEIEAVAESLRAKGRRHLCPRPTKETNF
jgi:hypothetical protein